MGNILGPVATGRFYSHRYSSLVRLVWVPPNLINTWLQPGATGNLLNVLTVLTVWSPRCRFVITALKCGVNEKFLLTFLVISLLMFLAGSGQYRRKLPPLKYLW